MTENSTALLFDILDTATQGDPDSAANNIALLNQLLTATDNDPSNISANETALLTEILSIITDQPPDVAANEIAVLTEILSEIQTQNPQVRANKIALLNEIAANSGSLSDVLNIVAPSDLIAWYPFRQGTGVDATAGIDAFGDTTDYSATVNGATFQATGGVTDIQTGANSGAFDFDGVDDTLDLGTVADSDQSLTLMAWVNPDTLGSNFQRLISKAKGDLLSQDGTIFLDISTQSKIRFGMHNNGSFTIIKSPTAISADKYVHVAGRYSFPGGDESLFVNGQPVDSASVGQLPSFSSQPWRLGEDDPTGPDEFLDGTLDGTRIYTAALSDSQINQIYLNTKP